MIDVSLDNLNELRKHFNPDVVNKALKAGLKKTANKTRTHISKEVRKKYNVKAGDIKETVFVKFSYGSNNSKGAILYTGKRISLLKFGANVRKVKTGRGMRTGATVRVKKSGGRKLVKGGFFGFGNSGNFMIFKRMGATRLPIKRLTGPAIAQMVGTRSITSSTQRFVGNEFEAQFIQAMNYYAQ